MFYTAARQSLLIPAAKQELTTKMTGTRLITQSIDGTTTTTATAANNEENDNNSTKNVAVFVDERSVFPSRSETTTVYKMTLPTAWVKEHGLDKGNKRKVRVFMDTKGRLILEA